ncbi:MULTISPECIES: hypothetical protein [Mumia]|uniref:hypothetical protein n=1 Tax=Mumia TaxID=1546255 RepID=UPI00142195DA|nr:hypothetical protein [Mumia sp. ZJ1417]QMW67695.1 hypothetical protein H4N58_07445 [Mumia sp. ZJ1417]
MLNLVSRTIIALVVSAAATIGVSVLSSAPAWSAEPVCTPPAVAEWTGLGYKCVIPGGGGPGQPGDPGDGGTPAEPTCDVSGMSPDDWAGRKPSAVYCVGANPCIDVVALPPVALPDGEKPNEESEARVQVCLINGMHQWGAAYWSDDEPEVPSLLEQALEAVGNIDLATPVIQISPQNRTIVNLDTWFWATGQQQNQTGSSAFGLVAIATFEHLVVTTGDGTTLTCEAASTREEAQTNCRHAYNRASVGGSESVDGRPAYAVTAESVYSLSFEVNGTPVANIEGAPATLTSPTATAALRVDEVQSVVTPGD